MQSHQIHAFEQFLIANSIRSSGAEVNGTGLVLEG